MSKKGTNYEYQVMNIFENNGYAALRSLGSGGGTKKGRPDVLVGNCRNIFGFEIKQRGGDVCYINKSQVDKLNDFCYRFGASPYIIVKFGRMPFYVFDENSMIPCEKSYKISVEDIGRGIELNDFISGV